MAAALLNSLGLYLCQEIKSRKHVKKCSNYRQPLGSGSQEWQEGAATFTDSTGPHTLTAQHLTCPPAAHSAATAPSSHSTKPTAHRRASYHRELAIYPWQPLLPHCPPSIGRCCGLGRELCFILIPKPPGEEGTLIPPGHHLPPVAVLTRSSSHLTTICHTFKENIIRFQTGCEIDIAWAE